MEEKFIEGFDEGLYETKGEKEMDNRTEKAIDILCKKYMMEELTDEQIAKVDEKVNKAIESKNKILKAFPKAISEAASVVDGIDMDEIKSYRDLERALNKTIKAFFNALKKEVTFKELTTIENYALINSDEISETAIEIIDAILKEAEKEEVTEE